MDEQVQKSSVKITLNYKGEAQVEVKIYDETTQDEATVIRNVAVQTFRDTLAELGMQMVTS